MRRQTRYCYQKNGLEGSYQVCIYIAAVTVPQADKKPYRRVSVLFEETQGFPINNDIDPRGELYHVLIFLRDPRPPLGHE